MAGRAVHRAVEVAVVSTTASIGKTIFTKLRQRRPDGNMIVPYWGQRGTAFGLIPLH